VLKWLRHVVVTALAATLLPVAVAPAAHASGWCDGGTSFTGTTGGTLSPGMVVHWTTPITASTEVELRATAYTVQMDVWARRPDGACNLVCWSRYAGSGGTCTATGVGDIHVVLSNGPTAVTYTLTERGALFSGPACSNRRDDDYDGATDYPADPGCTSPLDPTESSVGACDDIGGVTVCYEFDQGPVAVGLTAYRPEVTQAAPHTVRGFLDVYRFPLPGGASTTLPCVVLDVEGQPTNPCASAGGTFVTRTATLVDQTVFEPAVGLVPIATINVCSARVTATVAAVGVEDLPILAPC
jgi:hypothetical protein